MADEVTNPWDRSLQLNFLHACRAAHDLELALSFIGMAGNRHLHELQKALISHGAVTLTDIERTDATHPNTARE